MTHRRILQVASWILSRLVSEKEREALVGDLVEEYALRASAASPSAALRWCLRQVSASAPPLLWIRLSRAAWISTIGVALLAYIAVGVAEVTVNWAISNRTATGAFGFNPLGLVILFPIVLFIGYCAARFRRGAATLLGAMMLLVVTLMTLWGTETMPVGYRVAYFVTGPAAAFLGSAAAGTLRRA